MKIIAFEGADACGKETQSKLFYEYLINNNYKVAHYSFPRYDSQIGNLIKEYLDGKIQLEAFTVQNLFLLDMVEFNSDIQVMKDYSFDYLILDRFVLSNICYSLSIGLDLSKYSTLYEIIPIPDVNIVLSVPLKEADSRKTEKDDYEKNNTLMNTVRENYLKLCEIPKYNTIIINGTGDKEDIAESIKYLFNEGFLD